VEAKSKWDLAWSVRPPEEAHNFNPAFCGELIFRAVAEAHRAQALPFSFALSFLILPLTLHKPTRDVLPGRASVAFAGWIAEKNSLLADLPDRINRLRPITREAILFSIQHNLLGIQDGGLIPGSCPFRLTTRPAQTTEDANDARSAAGLLGRWFANQSSASSFMQGMGVAP
jgi:hypothetical protein